MDVPDWKAFRVLLMGAACLAVGLGGTGCGEEPPEAPAGLEAVSKDGAVVLKWSAVQRGNVTGYNVYRSTSSFEEPSEAQKVNKSLTENPTYTDDRAKNGTTYHYRVTAVAKAGGVLGLGGGARESPPSGEVQKTPFARPPDRP